MVKKDRAENKEVEVKYKGKYSKKKEGAGEDRPDMNKKNRKPVDVVSTWDEYKPEGLVVASFPAMPVIAGAPIANLFEELLKGYGKGLLHTPEERDAKREVI